jgi:hypothetical protein
MVFLLLFTVSSKVIINAGVCGHWVKAAVVAGIIPWSDIVPYTRHNTDLCALPILKYIRCCSLNFNITYPVDPQSGPVFFDGLLLNVVHDPVCGLVSMGSCQPLFYSEDLEYLNISADEMVFGVTDGNVPLDNWTIVGICGLCALAFGLLAYFSLEIYKTCCHEARDAHYAPIK